MISEDINLILLENSIVRQGLKSLLSRDNKIKIAGESETGKGIIKLLEGGSEGDMILMDNVISDMDALDFVSLLRKDHPHVKIIFLTSFADEKFVKRAIETGVSGYLLKSIGMEELIFAIQHIHNNEMYICTKLTVDIFNRMTLPTEIAIEKGISAPNFSKREIEILSLISLGYTNDQISDKLFTSKRTVENYRQGLIDKTGSKNIISLVRFALLNGLIS